MQTKNRGALSNKEGRFEVHHKEIYDDGWWQADAEEDFPTLETVLIPENAKSIISRNDSPDLSFEQSINPYRGCEHGCIYCYARPSHAYMNLSPGLDFETKIFHKSNAGTLLAKELSKPNYICKPIVLGANTDPYQPAESKLKITQQILKVCERFKQPVAIITKSALIERDLALLETLAKQHLVSVAVSITTLRLDLKRTLEPRTSSPQARLRCVKKLSELGIPTRVMVAPIIPMINDMELEGILKRAAEAKALAASYVLIRLPYEVKDLFKEWLQNHFPDRANHVMSLIKQMRGGKEYDATFGKRMRGEGEFANLIALRFQKACKRFNLNQTKTPGLTTTLFNKNADSNQRDLWDT